MLTIHLTTGVLQSIEDFLNRGKDLNTLANDPSLFCDDTWLEEKTWDNPVLSAMGNFYVVTDGQGNQRFKLIHEQYPDVYVDDFVDQPKADQLVPYWGAVISSYLFESPGGDCNNDNLGTTSFAPADHIAMTLCPESFVQPRPGAPAASLGQVGQSSGEFQARAPPSLTLFHE